MTIPEKIDGQPNLTKAQVDGVLVQLVDELEATGAQLEATAAELRATAAAADTRASALESRIAQLEAQLAAHVSGS